MAPSGKYGQTIVRGRYEWVCHYSKLLLAVLFLKWVSLPLVSHVKRFTWKILH